MGRIQDSTPLSTPDVGSTPSSTAKSHTPVIANQKSGMLAAVIDSRLEKRSASEFGRYAAQQPMTTAPTIARSIVVKASCSVAGNARSAISEADSPVRSEVPKSRWTTPLK